MASSRHHAEWLSLIEVSGPFLTMPVLERVFPQGLDAHDSETMQTLRLAHGEWEDNADKPGIHKAWIEFILKNTLALPDEVVAEGQAIPQTLKATIALHNETLRPDIAIRNPNNEPNAGVARMLICTYPPDQDIDKAISGRHWKATPATRMMELLHATGVRLGLVTNGEQWMIVDAPKDETTGFASWYAYLWFEEPVTLRAFRSLLGVSRFFSVPDGDTLAGMLAESATHQQEVTDQLGLQVRRAVEVLIQSLDRADQDHQRALLSGVPEAVLYEAALTVMMRLVFLFSAEERDLLLLGDPLYDQHYAVSTLVAQLQEAADQHGEEVLERRNDAWVRLLAMFRGVFAGVRHERMRLPAYSGNLFNPDRFPFLEGRAAGTTWQKTPATPLPINNRTVLHLLRSLQYLQLQGEARRLSFRALDIEQIGHVYEGLLDHTAKRATEHTLGLLAAKNSQFEIALSELEKIHAKGTPELVAFLKEETDRSVSALNKALAARPDDAALNKLRAMCGNDEALFQRVRPFAALLRNDTFERPVVVRKGSVFVTSGTDRRSSGTHYTPRSLTEPIVQYTLEPLVYIGPAEGKPKEEWKLRPAKELLALKICDMACGSGAFLVQACRYMSERMIEAWEDAIERHPGVPGITPDGEASTGAKNEMLIPSEDEERLVYARRLIAQRCLYGVDKNPLAVEMAKLSLWLITMQKSLPFTFLDHAIKCGDSLLGFHALEQLEAMHISPKHADSVPSFWQDHAKSLFERAVALRRELEALPVLCVADSERKAELHAQAEDALELVHTLCDLIVGAAISTADGNAAKRDGAPSEAFDEERENILVRIAGMDLMNDATIKDSMQRLKKHARELLDKHKPPHVSPRNPFHWPVEFPEVFPPKKVAGPMEQKRLFGDEQTKLALAAPVGSSGGFHAIVGNPPFMGGTKLEPGFGADYREFIVQYLADDVRGIRGTADLCAYFFRRAVSVLGAKSALGLLATNTIAQGDTRAVGLEWILSAGFAIPRAIPSQKWPGAANLEIAIIWLLRGKWDATFVLNGSDVIGITADLTAPSGVSGNPFQLSANFDLAFEGAKTIGLGFLLDPTEAMELKRKNPKNGDVLYPYLIGQDLNSRSDQTPSRWTITFRDWPLNHEDCPKGYSGPVAADYPDCLKIIEERVKPERLSYPDDSAWNRAIRARWWQFALWRPALHTATKKLRHVFVRSRVSNINSIAIAPAGIVFSDATVVFAFEDMAMFALLQSSIHTAWIEKYSSSMRNDVRYTPSSCFDTFARPSFDDNIRLIATHYLESRSEVMSARNEGLTKTYNRFYDRTDTSPDIQKLRELHVEMDEAVARAYGWDDLKLGHGFHPTKQGERFTLSPPARQEVLDRLLALNHQRYAEEVKAGLHDKKSSGKAKKPTPLPKASQVPGLFDPQVVDPVVRNTTCEKLLCALVLRLVRMQPGLHRNAFLDSTRLGAQPDACATLLTGDDRKEFLKQRKTVPAELTLKPMDGLPWRNILKLLIEVGGIREGAGNTLVIGAKFDQALALYPKLDEAYIRIVHKAAERLRELAPTQQQPTERKAENAERKTAAEFESEVRELVNA